MAFGIESYKKMEIPIPNDENIILVPRTLFWVNHRKGGWSDAILVFTNKGIHFRVRKDVVFDKPGVTLDDGHTLLENTFLAYDRILNYAQGTMLWKTTVAIQMVDGTSMRFGFHKDIAKVMQLLPQLVQLGTPRNTEPYDYDSHKPQSVPHQMVSAPK